MSVSTSAKQPVQGAVQARHEEGDRAGAGQLDARAASPTR